MTNINALYPSKYLKAADLKRPDGTNASMTLTIERVVVEQLMEDKPEKKPCLYFVGKQKGMVLNKTNGLMIAHSYGEEIESWANRPVQLYIEAVPMQGKIVDAIRVRIPAQVVQQAAQQPVQVVQQAALTQVSSPPTETTELAYEQEQKDTAAVVQSSDDFDDDDIPF